MNRLRRRDRSGFSKGKQSSIVKYLKEISGYPLSVSNFLSLVELTISGSAVQDGTPSPDNPVEIQGCGDRTANLFDVLKMTSPDVQTDKNKVTLTKYASSTGINISSFISMTGLKPGDTITTRLRIRVVSGAATAITGRMSILGAGNVEKGALILVDRCLSGEVVQTVQIPDNFNTDNYGGLYVYGSSSGGVIELSGIQIVKGSYTAETMPPYEPYGYKIPVEVSGRNLFDVHNLNLCMTTISSTGYTPKVENDILYSGGRLGYASGKFPYVAIDGKPITISFTISGETPTGYIYGFDEVDDNGVIVGSVILNTLSSNLGAVNFTYNGTKKYIGFCLYSENRYGVALSDIQILEGTYTAETIPPYEPYHVPQTFNVYTPEPLYGVGDSHDTVILDFDRRKAELVKYAGYFDLNNIANLAYGSQQQTLNRSYFFPSPAMKAGTGLKGYCNLLIEYGGWNDADFEHVHFGQSNSAVYLITINKYNRDDMIEYLSNNGQSTPYVIYPLATPTTTDITDLQDWDAMPELWEGSVIITSESDIEPSNLNLKYYSSVE